MEYKEICKRAAKFLTGSHKPIYANNKVGLGDVVIVCNAANMRMHGDKLKYEKLRYHSGHPGGLKTRYFRDYVIKKPEFLYYYGVYKQLAPNKLRFRRMDKLYVYAGAQQFAEYLPNVS